MTEHNTTKLFTGTLKTAALAEHLARRMQLRSLRAYAYEGIKDVVYAGGCVYIDDVDHYKYICAALERTMQLQTEIDAVYGEIDAGEIVEFASDNAQTTL